MYLNQNVVLKAVASTYINCNNNKKVPNTIIPKLTNFPEKGQYYVLKCPEKAK